MFCSFNTGKNQEIYKAFTTALTALMNQISNDPTAKFDVNEIMKMIYARTMDKTGDHEQAVNNARMVPNIISKIANNDKASAVSLLPKGLDMNALFALSVALEAEADGMDKTVEALGLSGDILNEGADAVEGDSTEDVPEELPEDDLEGANPPAGQLTFSFDEETDEVEVVDVTEPEETEEGEIIIPQKKIIDAVAPHALKDTDQEALSMDPRDPRYNVIDPAKKFFYTVKRAIIRLFKGESTGDIELPGAGKIYLRAQSSSTLPAKSKLGDTTPVVMVVVNEKGEPVKFDDAGNVSKSGKISFYNLRNPYDENGEYERLRVEALSRILKIDMIAAREHMARERAVVNQVLDYISKDVNNSVIMNITGGTLGYLGNQNTSYPISQIAFGTNTFNPVIGADGNYHFSLPTVSEQTIPINQTAVKDSPELVDLFANLLVDDVYDRAGVKYTNGEKRALIERYLLLNTNRLTIINAGPKLMGQMLDVSTPEAKEKAKQAIRDFFNNVSPYKVVTAQEAAQRIANSKGGKIVTDLAGATVNDILQTTDETTGEPILRTLVNTTLNITQAGMTNGNHFSLAPRAEGGMAISMIPGGYINDFIKNNFKVSKLLNGQNELVSLNAYFTFSPASFETGKLDVQDDETGEKEIVEEGTKGASEEEKNKAIKLSPQLFQAVTLRDLATLKLNRVKTKGKTVTKAQIFNEIKATFDMNVMLSTYTLEFAQQVLDETVKLNKFTPAQAKELQAVLDKYLAPTKAPVSRPALTIEEIRADLQSKYDYLFATAKGSDEIAIAIKAKKRLDEFNEKYPIETAPTETGSDIDAKIAEIEKRKEDRIKKAESKFWKNNEKAYLDFLDELGGYELKAFKNDQEIIDYLKQRIEAKANAELAALQGTTETNTVDVSTLDENTTEPESATQKRRRRTSKIANSGRISPQTQQDDKDSGFGKQIDEDDISWSKNVVQRSNGTITDKQLQDAKTWYESHPLSKFVSFREMFTAVNSQDPNSIATMSLQGIVLYKGSNLTDLYHEAFHAFSQFFMTPEQRAEIYSEVRKKPGTFRDHDGKLVAFEVANDTQVEEYLAEEFRKYMLRGGKAAKTVKAEPKTKRFFDKLAQILEFLFGDLTVQEIAAGDRANAKIDELFEKLRIGDMSGYAFDKANMSAPVYNKSGIQAANENESRINLTEKESKLMLDSMDAWIAMTVDAANSGIEDKVEYDKFMKKQVEWFLGKKTPAQMEAAKLKMAPKLTYSQTVLFLKSKQGRTFAYERISQILAELEIGLRNERAKILKKNRLANVDDINRKLSLIMWSRDNFGDLNNIENNKPKADGSTLGLIGYHMQKSRDFGAKVVELIDAAETPDEQKSSRSEYSDRSGNEVSTKEMAKQEVIYLFKTLFRMDPETGAIIQNEIGAPQLVDFALVWNKVTQILENELNAETMYKKLLEYATQPKQTEITAAVRQLLTKLGPLGLSTKKFPHLANSNVVDLWTNFHSVFSTRRIPLIAQEITVDKEKGNVTSKIGRNINPYARIGNSWNAQFRMSNITGDTNKYVEHVDGTPRLNTKAILADFKDYDYIMKNNLQREFLNAIGIKFTDNDKVNNALMNGDSELDVPGKYHIIKTLMMKSDNRLTNNRGFKEENGSLPSYEKSNRGNTEYLSLMELYDINDIMITQPEDLLHVDRKGSFIGGYQTVSDPTTSRTMQKPLYIDEIEGEGRNWNQIRSIEGQYGDGVVSYMVTTASGTTQFEQSLNSSMSIMITSMNSAKDYQDLIKMPHMSHFDIKKNPSAKNHVWLKNMFDLDPKSSTYGQRKKVNGVEVKLQLRNLSGFKTNEANGVASASADPFTKFIGDLHLAAQTGSYELMRHSDKNTSYMVGLNYVMSPDGIGGPMSGMYINNLDFLDSREKYGARAFVNYILPNLSSEHARIQRLKKKKVEINAAIEQRRKEIASGQTENLTPIPVYDFEYLKNGQKFLMFQGVYNKNLKDQLLEIEGDVQDALLNNPAYSKLKEDLIKETNEYFEKRFEEAKHYYDKAGFIATNLKNTFIAQHKKKYIDLNGPDSWKTYVAPGDSQIEEALLNAYVYNAWIHNVESMNGLYGDIALYNHAKEAFHKRNAGIASTGTGYRTDASMLNYINDHVGRGFEEQFHGGSIRTYDGTLNTGIMQDKITRSEYLEEIAHDLFKQMSAAAVRANNSLPVERRKSTEDIEKNIKQKLTGNPDIDMSSAEALEGFVPARKSIMYGYYAMNEADAQGWITMDAYRILAKSQGEWGPVHEKMYQSMLAGEEIPGDKLGTFFPPLKTQYWGPIKSEGDPIFSFHKFQLTPIIPSTLKNTPKLQKLNDKMLKQGMDYVLFESGSKTGSLTSVQYDAYGMPIRVKNGKNISSRLENGETNPEYNESLDIASIKDQIYNEAREVTDNDFTVNTIYVNFLKNQLKIEPKFKGKTVIPTQIRKLVTVDLMANGIPTDYMVSSQLEDRIESWNELDEAEREAASANYMALRKFEKSVFNLTSIKRQQLLTKAKLTVNAEGEVRGNIENLIKYVKSQLTDQDISDHELDFIDWDASTGGLKNDLSFSLSSDKIERLLNALITKALVKQKMKGEPLIQVASAMLEKEPQFRAATKEENLRFNGTNGLRYYRLNKATGKIDPMEVKIAMQGDFEKLLYLPDVAVYENELDATGKVIMFKGKPVQKLNYNASLAKLNILIKDENWLNKDNNRLFITAHGDRIPIQGLNSDEVAIIAEFLPKEQGNIIILPSEIVAKTGGDFDIDKLTMMFPNISLSTVMNEDGTYTSEVGLYKAFTNEEYRQKYEEYKQKKATEFITRGLRNSKDKAKALELYYASGHLMQFVLDENDRESFVTGKKKYEGQSINAANSQIIDILIEEAELLTFEEFILKDQEKAAQNEFLFSLNELTMNGANYMNLVRPNGTDILDPIVDELRGLYRDYDPSFSTNDEAVEDGKIQATRIFEIGYNLDKHMRNNYGKKALGIGAIDNTYNEIMNRVGMYLVPNNREINGGFERADIEEAVERLLRLQELENHVANNKELKLEEKVELDKLKTKAYEDMQKVMSFEGQTLYLPHNTLSVKDIKGSPFQDKAISFSHSMDVNAEHKVGDVINQLMNGWVDIANDAWIFYLRANEKLGPMLSFLIQAGVPVQHAARMISQPVIVEYMETIDKLQSTYSDALVGDLTSEEVEKITRDRAILKAKEVMLEKLGYDLDKGGQDRVANVNKTIALESALALPKVLNENNELDSYLLKDQLDYVASAYPVFDKKTGRPMPISSANIDYTDDTLSDMQRAVFLHFLQIANMESALKDVKLRTNFDTTQSGSLYDAQNKINQLMELKRSRMDSTNNSQTKFWRIPSEVIERMVPTIKRADGSDTGILDESKAASILAGFYQQPFQLAMWRDLFPVKNNSVIDGYLSDMDFNQRDNAKKDTYLETDEKVITEFKNSIIPLIFQNSFLGFDISELDKDNSGKVGSYRGSEVRLNSAVSLPNWGAVARMEPRETSSGIVIEEPVIYYDYNTLYHQFIHKTFATPAYEEVGLAKLDSNQFNSFGEYVKFIFEREYLRINLLEGKGRELAKNLRKNTEFKEIHAQVTKTLKQDLEGGESLGQFQSRKNRVAFEQFIRNKALKNVYNMHAMFNGSTSFAYEIASIKSDPRLQGLVEAFPILNAIIPDSESSRSSEKERVNFAFVEAPKDPSTINSYHEQLKDLANEIALQRAMPGLDRERIGEIADVFKRFPIAAFMQSGMTTTGRFSFGRVVDQSTIYAMTKGPADDFIEKITEEKSRNVKETLDSYWKAFIAANKRYDARGKNLTVNTDKQGKPTSNIDNQLWVNEKGRAFDPHYLTEEGTLTNKRAIKVGDELKVTFFIKGKSIDTSTTVQDVYWNGKRIIVKSINNNTKGDSAGKVYTLMYDEEANLIQWQSGDGKINTANSISAKIILGPYLINQLKNGKVEETKVGGTVEYLMINSKDGSMIPKTATVLELEELGYPVFESGGYKEGLERYRIKAKYETQKGETIVHFVIDSSGKLIEKILDNGNITDPRADARSKFYVELPVNRKKGQYTATSLDDARKGINTGSIVPGTIVDVISPTDYSYVTKSTLYVYDEGSMNLIPLEQTHDPVQVEEGVIRLDETQFFAVYNGVITPGASVYSDGQSTPASKVGKVDIRDRFMEHSGFTNKATLITRNKYSGGSLVEFFTDNIDPETGKATVHDWVKQVIDNCLDGIQAQIDTGLTPIFNEAGYGQYMIGADDATGKIIKDANGKAIGEPAARETFLYLSQQLMQRFGFMNPNYVTQPEGQQEYVKAIDQPVSDQEYMDLMNKCFNINVSR